MPPRTVAHEGPVYERPVAAPGQPGRAARPTLPPRCRGRRPATSCARRCLRMIGCPNLCSRALGHRAVRPLRARQHRARRARRRRHRPGRRGSTGPRHRDGHRLQRPVHHARPVRRRAAGAGRGVPQRRGHRRHPAGGHQLPELRFARGSRRDVAVPAGRPRPGGRLCARSAFRSPAATSASTTRPARRRILPTPVVGVLGVIDDVSRRIPTGIGTEPGETLLLLGDTRDEFDGSIWAQVTHEHLGGLPPKVDLAREQLLGEVLIAGVARRHGLRRPRPVRGRAGPGRRRDGLAGETGCRIVLPEGADPFVSLFSESAGRVLVAVPRTEESRFTEMCEARGLPVDPHRRGGPGQRLRRGAGPVHGLAGGPAEHVGGRAARVVRVSAPTETSPANRSPQPERGAHPAAWAWSLVRPRLRRRRVRRAVLLPVADAVAAAARLAVPGLIGGINAAIGYGIGVVVGKMLHRFVLRAEGGGRRRSGCCTG